MRIEPLKPIIGVAAAIMVAGAVAVGVPALTTQGADHLDAPLVQADGRIDINDLYVFESPSDPNNTVLAMTVNPLAGVLSPTTLRPGAKYEIAIDNDGDAEADIVYRVQASGSSPQNISLRKVGGGGVLAKGSSEDTLSVKGGGSLYVGLRDDPFFFDFAAFGNGLAFCPGGVGTDFFAGVNATAIVLEVPTQDLLGGSPDIGVWARTLLDDEQIERMGRPIINTALIPGGSKDAFNATKPVEDVASWTGDVVASLLTLNGDAGYSAAVAAIVLPDILTYDTSMPASYLNGRGLADDIGDVTLDVVSMGAILSDCVDANDVPFLGMFPYLAGPH